MALYSGEGGTFSPPLSPTPSRFPKEEEEEEERGKWEDIITAIKFVAGNNVDGGGGGP